MSEPQLRCLLCDLLLADENARDHPTETCTQCGRKVLAGQTTDEPTVTLQPLNPPPRSKPLDLDLELLPDAAVVTPVASPPPTPPADDIPSVPLLSKARRAEPDVPTVQPRGKITTDPAGVPYATRRAGEAPSVRTGPATPTSPPPPARPGGKAIPPFPAKKVNLPNPARVPDATPRPKVLQAFGVLGCMTLMAIAAIVVIISCIVIGLMKAAKVGG